MTLPEEMRERVAREMEAMVWQVIGQRTTLIDHRNKGLIRDFAERYAKRFDDIFEEVDRKARIAMLAKIANKEGWEDTAYIYCTKPEIGISPNEFEMIRYQFPGESEES